MFLLMMMARNLTRLRGRWLVGWWDDDDDGDDDVKLWVGGWVVMSPAPKPPPWPPAGGLGRVRVAAATIILSSHTHIHQLGLLVLGTRLISISARIFFILHIIVVVWRTKVFSRIRSWGEKNVTNTTMKAMKLMTIEKPQRWIFCTLWTKCCFLHDHDQSKIYLTANN